MFELPCIIPHCACSTILSYNNSICVCDLSKIKIKNDCLNKICTMARPVGIQIWVGRSHKALTLDAENRDI